ncbi:hypothetical protein ACFV6U_40150, partial [Streptomyces sp. NPDC059810]
MAEILVLVDHADGAVRKPALELLTLARRIGEPSAVVLGAGEAAGSLRAPPGRGRAGARDGGGGGAGAAHGGGGAGGG